MRRVRFAVLVAGVLSVVGVALGVSVAGAAATPWAVSTPARDCDITPPYCT
jgi:hypothetical protein